MLTKFLLLLIALGLYYSNEGDKTNDYEYIQCLLSLSVTQFFY